MSGRRRPGQPPERPNALQRRARGMRAVGFYTAIPTMMVVGPVLGYFLGSWVEGRFGHAPWFVFGGVVLGGVASVRQVSLLLQRGTAESSRESLTRGQRKP